jgi:hypothetical protein
VSHRKCLNSEEPPVIAHSRHSLPEQFASGKMGKRGKEKEIGNKERKKCRSRQENEGRMPKGMATAESLAFLPHSAFRLPFSAIWAAQRILAR